MLARRLELAARRLREAAARSWSDLVAERRREEAEREAQRAREARRAAGRHPVLEELAQENVRLAERRTLPVGVAYRSDVALVERLLLEAARSHPEVLEDPAPDVVFNFLGSTQGLNRVRTEINRAMDDLFRRHGVEIPFPQRVVHLRGERPAADRDRST